jgi:Flp pilus assembly protein TadG
MKKFHKGSVTVEVVLLAPVLVLVAMLIVHAGRMSDAHLRVQHAADVAARAASQVRESAMVSTAQNAALAELMTNGVPCVDIQVTVRRLRDNRNGSVEASVSCLHNVQGLQSLRVRQVRVSATSREIIDRFTFR